MKEKQTVYALGFFDGVHLGHQTLLKACREMAENLDCLAGAITFDTHPQSVIGKNPVSLINTARDRQELLEKVGGLDRTILLPFHEAMRKLSYLDFFRMMVDEYHAAGFVCGTDYRFGYKGQGNAQILQTLCQSENIPCKVLCKLKIDGIEVSSSQIRQLLSQGQVEKANALLGHPHLLSGQVIPGQQLGRTLQTPTANLPLPEELDCLQHGVYICQALVDGKTYPAVTNVGIRPTVNGNRANVESFLLDFSGDLYGKQLQLSFYKFLRPEKKFSSLQELQAEIQKNAQQTKNFFKKSQ